MELTTILTRLLTTIRADGRELPEATIIAPTRKDRAFAGIIRATVNPHPPDDPGGPPATP